MFFSFFLDILVVRLFRFVVFFLGICWLLILFIEKLGVGEWKEESNCLEDFEWRSFRIVY